MMNLHVKDHLLRDGFCVMDRMFAESLRALVVLRSSQLTMLPLELSLQLLASSDHQTFMTCFNL
jgi:hypothetical protein